MSRAYTVPIPDSIPWVKSPRPGLRVVLPFSMKIEDITHVQAEDDFDLYIYENPERAFRRTQIFYAGLEPWGA